ncbi:MAG: hypothetical protein IIX02_00595, partial [Clostridia bacterium]|nr:hypothetical protein [Clostridia bacterium]
IYQKVSLYRIHIGRKRRKKFLDAHAKIASKFIMLNSEYGEKIAGCAEVLYRSLEKQNLLELIDKPEDCACAIFFLAGLKELGTDPQRIAAAFEADFEKVQALLACVLASREDGEEENEDNEENTQQEEKIDEVD